MKDFRVVQAPIVGTQSFCHPHYGQEVCNTFKAADMFIGP